MVFTLKYFGPTWAKVVVLWYKTTGINPPLVEGRSFFLPKKAARTILEPHSRTTGSVYSNQINFLSQINLKSRIQRPFSGCFFLNFSNIVF